MRAPPYSCYLLAGVMSFASTRLRAQEIIAQDASLARAKCAQVELTGAQAACTPSRCTVSGHAELVCGDLRLRADALTVDADESHHFAQATAEGHVQLTQGQVRVDAQTLVLGHDRISGRVVGATLRYLRGPIAPASPGDEKAALVAHGTLTRDSSGEVTLTDADVTLCDCGALCPPTWLFRAPKVSIDGRRRALVWWPRLELHVGRGWMLPITPPLFFVSLPLSRRATGFLPPKLRFYSAARPTVDFPFFIPLGPHADVTLTAGLRTDWAESHSASLLGAPRLGAKMRYAPIAGTYGEMRGVATYDARQKDGAKSSPPLRLRLDWRHDSSFGEAQEVTLVARWLSDPQYLKDFEIRPTERIKPYVASRGQWLLRRPRWVTTLSFDALQRLTEDSAQVVAPSPLVGATPSRRQTLQRVPALRATLLPRGSGLKWAPRQTLLPTGEVYAARYARLRGAAANGSDAEGALGVVGALIGAQSVGLMGPIATRFSLALDMLGVAAEHGARKGGVGGRAGGELVLRAVGTFGAWQHLLEPRLRLEAITPLWGAQSIDKAQEERGLDEHLRPRKIQQASLSLNQRVTHVCGFATSLDVAQPVDLRLKMLLQPDLALSAAFRERAALDARMSLRPWAGRQAYVREAHLSAFVKVGWARLAGSYARVAPNADRATRSIYELSAPRRPDAPAIEQTERWVHAVTGKLTAQVTERWRASYQGSYQLPRPAPQGTSDCPSGSRHCFVYHTLEAQLTSACRCWGMTALVGVAPGNIAETFRVQFGFTLGADAAPFSRGKGALN